MPYSILAFEWLKARLGWLPYCVAVLCGVLLAIAFVIGAVKGGARVRWGGFAWLVAGVGFVFADKYLHTKNPVYTFMTARGFDERVTSFASAISLAAACVLVTLLFYGVFAVICRRKRRAVKAQATFEKSVRYGSYEGFDIDEDETTERGAKPSGLGRLMGGVLCAVNTAAVLATLICIALLVVDSTKLKDGALEAIYTVPAVNKLLPYVAQYALDLAIVGVVFAVAFAGAKKGFTETLRVIVVKIGGLCAIALCLYLPFSRFASSNSFLNVIVSRCVGLFSKLGVSEKVYTVCGKIAAGVLMGVMVALAFALLNWLLKLLGRSVRRGGFFRALDRMLACLVYLALGVLLCALIWAVLYVFAHYGVFHMGGLTRGATTLSKGFFETFDVYLQPWLVRLSAKLKSIF